MLRDGVGWDLGEQRGEGLGVVVVKEEGFGARVVEEVGGGRSFAGEG